MLPNPASLLNGNSRPSRLRSKTQDFANWKVYWNPFHRMPKPLRLSMLFDPILIIGKKTPNRVYRLFERVHLNCQRKIASRNRIGRRRQDIERRAQLLRRRALKQRRSKNDNHRDNSDTPHRRRFEWINFRRTIQQATTAIPMVHPTITAPKTPGWNGLNAAASRKLPAWS